MTKLRFRSLDPSKAYVRDNLYIPLKAFNPEPLKSTLTFQLTGKEDIVEDGELVDVRVRTRFCWDQTDTHFIIPREYPLDFGALPHLEWVDQRPFTGPEVHLTTTATPSVIQLEALDAMRRCRSGTVNLACGLGKTVLALLYAVERKKPTLVVLDKGAVLGNWLEEIAEHLGPDVPVGIIQGKQCDWEGYPIVLASLRTLVRNRFTFPTRFRTYFGQVFYDEGHHMSAEWFALAADMFFGDRFALTATATRRDNLHHIFQYHLGPVIYQNLQQDLVPHTTFFQLLWRPTKEQEEQVKNTTGTPSWGKFASMLAEVDWRNDFIVHNLRDDLEDGRTCLILTLSRAQARVLYDLVKPTMPGAVLIDGNDGRGHEERVLALKNNNPVIATFELAKEALNKKTLDSLALANTHKSDNDTQQAWGRIQRALEGKRQPLVKVYEDLPFKMSVRQARAIRRYLKLSEYPFDEQIVEIK